MSGPALIEARSLSVAANGRRLLDRVSLSVAPGEILTVVGPNGGGKTTLLRALIGALRPSDGSVRRAPGLMVGYMPQKLAIDRSLPLDVGRFLTLGGGDGDGAAALLERVGAGARAGAQLADLSGGELQRVLLARALLRRPQLLMLDEPTQGLDHRGAARFYRLIAELRDEFSLAVLLVSHDLHVVMGASDRVVCLNGHVCCDGAPAQVSSHPEYQRLFGVEEEPDAVAIYRHDHDHDHDHDQGHGHGRLGAPSGADAAAETRP